MKVNFAYLFLVATNIAAASISIYQADYAGLTSALTIMIGFLLLLLLRVTKGGTK